MWGVLQIYGLGLWSVFQSAMTTLYWLSFYFSSNFFQPSLDLQMFPAYELYTSITLKISNGMNYLVP